MNNNTTNDKTTTWLVHYNEIGLKGKNRAYFEKQLTTNIKASLGQKNIKKAVTKRLQGKIILKTITTEKIRSALKNTFGIAWSAKVLPVKFGEIEKRIEKLASKKKFKTFAIRAKISHQSSKINKITSKQMEVNLGDVVRQKNLKKVDLTNPDVTFFVESGRDDELLVYTKKLPGPGGLPVGSGGKALCLLSGGIDSPVAGYKIMSRGAENLFVHFHSYPQTSIQSINKTKKIVQILKNYQPKKIKLFLVPILEAQKEIHLKVNKRFLIILYRRLMLRLAQRIAEKNNCQALVTGDSLGQVASQTIENIAVQDQAVSLPVFRPLIGLDKNTIISVAKKINTFQTSIQPHQDCCTLFIPSSPITRGRIEMVKKEEGKYNINKLMEVALKNTESVEI